MIIGCGGGGALLLQKIQSGSQDEAKFEPVIEQVPALQPEVEQFVWEGTAPTSAPDPKPAKDPPPKPEPPQDQNESIPIDFPAAAEEDFELDVVESMLRRYPDSYSYELKARLLIGPIVAKQIQGEVILKSPDGEQLGKVEVNLLSGSHEVLPGDSLPIQALIFQKKPAPAAAEAVLNFDDEKTVFLPHHEDLDRGAPIEFGDPQQAHPSTIKLAARERALVSEANYLKEENTDFRLLLELENTGKADIRALKIYVQPYDANSADLPVSYGLIETDWPPNVSPVAFAQYPAWKPGERRIELVRLTLPNVKPDRVAGYRVGIYSVE
ncbi:MAG: hypothetical protein AAF585_10690 [Verrucomicrobiota bacterium]